jgi:hypothetical protein
VSLEGFQQAAVELTLDHRKTGAVRNGDLSPLDAYELSDRERARLIAITRQPTMAVHCSLSRGNRIEIIGGAFPMTCCLLDAEFGPLIDELWRDHRPSNYQLRGEELAFAALVRRRLEAGAIAVSSYLAEVFEYECLCLELTARARASGARVEAVMVFTHPPSELLPPLSRLSTPPADLPRGRYPARIRLERDVFDVVPLEA